MKKGLVTVGVYGYIRKNNSDCLMTQIEQMQLYSCEDIYIEEADFQICSELDRLLTRLEEHTGDTLVVCSLLAFGKGIKQSKDLFETLKKQNVRLISIKEGIDTNISRGDLYEIIIMLSEIDHQYHVVRTQVGLQKASTQGISGGRPTIPLEKIKQIILLRQEKNLSVRNIAQRCSVSVGTVHKYLKS